MAWQHSPVTIIHFDVEAQNMYTEKLNILRPEIVFKYSVFDMPDNENESKIHTRWTLRLTHGITEKQVGSSVTEQFFYIGYKNDEAARKEILQLLINSHFMSSLKFEEQRDRNGLPREIRYPAFDFSAVTVEDILVHLQGRPRQK